MSDEQAEDSIVEKERADKAKRRQRIQMAVAVAVLIFIFGVLLPQLVDYDAVWEAIRSLSTGQFVVLLLLGLLQIPINAAQYAGSSHRSGDEGLSVGVHQQV